ncbi:outer membrane beta-barrel protein [Hymenobacter ruricola]|uniref:PorT family protein n=1 Tax=Hymenobacter ruricola TaxID=2791023 RepID=A0ABS0HYJ0_9BACT|nr:outer membrane beta-barrel protein [Hymenobacter ruricola]MBF9219694.1 PorT family protein [Hymenobacter ruricola]
MKKIFLFLLLAVASAPAAFAQAAPGGAQSSKDYTGGATAESGNTGFGVKGGYSLANVYGDDAGTGRSSSNSFHAGLYGQFGFNDFSSIQAEVLYSRQGTKFKDGVDNLRLDYLSVPVLYVGNITDKFSFHIGPQASILTKVVSGDKDLDINDNGFQSFDLSGVGGLEYRIGPARLGARYNLGLTKISKEAKVYNNVLQVYVGFGFTQ